MQSETTFMHWSSIEWSPYGIKKSVTCIRLSSYFGTRWIMRSSVFRRLLVVHMILVRQPSLKGRRHILSSLLGTRTIWPCGPDGPWSGRSAVVVRTVHACAESVRVPSFLRGLLAKFAGLTRKTTCNGYRPPLYIDEGLWPIEPPQSIKFNILIVFTLCINISSSLAFLYLKSSPLFGFTSTRGVLGGLLTPRHTLGSLLLDGVPPGRRDLGLLRRRRPSVQSRTVRAPGADRSDVRLALCRGPSEPPQRAPPGGQFLCLRPD
jgi:hypothetical protein